MKRLTEMAKRARRKDTVYPDAAAKQRAYRERVTASVTANETQPNAAPTQPLPSGQPPKGRAWQLF